jgi:hypothetical protein
VIGGSDLGSVRQIAQRMVDVGEELWRLPAFNRFRLVLEGAECVQIPAYLDGRILRVPCYVRGRSRLPVYGVIGTVFEAVRRASDLPAILQLLTGASASFTPVSMNTDLFYQQVQAMELMLNEGWLHGEHDARLPVLQLRTPTEGRFIHTNLELNLRIERTS